MSRVLAIVDTETTGLPSDSTARVVELGLVVWDVDKDKLLWADATMVRPDLLTEKGLKVAKDISGIEPEEIFAGLSIPDAQIWWDRALGQVAKHGAVGLGAWNMPFDRAMLRRTLYGIEDPKEANSDPRPWIDCENAGDPTPWLTCWMQVFSDMFVETLGTRTAAVGVVTPRFAKLGYAVEQLGLSRAEAKTAHRALGDAIHCAKVGAAILRGDLAPTPIHSIKQLAPEHRHGRGRS